jgi:3-oxoacyl-[acyl-carrier-protein] synthase II
VNRRVVITGMGWVTPLGHDIDGVWKAILEGRSGVASTTLFDARTFPTSFSAEVKGFRLEDFLGARAKPHEGASRNSRFALAAAEAAWKQAGLANAAHLDRTRVGIYLGGGEGPIDFEPFSEAAVAGCRNEQGEPTPLNTVRWAQTALGRLTPSHEMEQEPNMAAGHMAVHFQVQGPSLNTLTACAASTQAIGEAVRVIQYGDADLMISGGTHSMIHPLGVTGFNRLTALSVRNDTCLTASRPFDRTRDGFVLGEGAGVLILEELDHARQRGAPLLAEVIGYGSTADAFRITDIHEDGRGSIAAMRSALRSAGVRPDQVDYISAHGTGTEENDKIETLAIRTLFGEHAKSVPISSVKSMIGHLIAAAGAVELITCVLALRDQVVPPTINYQNADPNCDLDYVPNQARRAKVRVCLSNSFGFGGQNDTLVIREIDS